jgi:hypothetical protein
MAPMDWGRQVVDWFVGHSLWELASALFVALAGTAAMTRGLRALKERRQQLWFAGSLFVLSGIIFLSLNQFATSLVNAGRPQSDLVGTIDNVMMSGTVDAIVGGPH